MTLNPVLLMKMKKILDEKGKPAQENVRQFIKDYFKNSSQISRALRYFSNGALRRCMPIFPALISLSCEAAGGKGKDTIEFGEAIVLLTGAADLHDDVIDQSFSKGTNMTVFGKFGSNVTILAGDVLLVEGIKKLHRQENLTNKKFGKKITDLITSAIIEISNAETEEFSLRKKGFQIKPADYQKIIWQKAAVPELSMRVGAILGGDDLETVDSLSQFGRTFGYVTVVIDEFANVFDKDELINRLKNECPPLPIDYLLQNQKNKKELEQFLLSDFSNDEAHKRLIEMIKDSAELQKIRESLVATVDRELQKMKKITQGETLEALETVLMAPLVYLDNLFL